MAKVRTKTCSLVLFWLIFCIAVGLPLFHPMLHSQLDHDGERRARLADISWLTPDDENGEECPVCHFLETNKLCADRLNPAILTALPVGFMIPANPLFESAIGSFAGQPRAPPLFTSTL